MKNFKFLRKKSKKIIHNLNRGTLYPINHRNGMVHYFSSNHSIQSEGQLSVEINTKLINTEPLTISSLREFREENHDKFIWVYMWKYVQPFEILRPFSNESDLPLDVPLILFCCVLDDLE